jgi:1,4-dihydroxy-2-naphthoyl-CoA synthase
LKLIGAWFLMPQIATSAKTSKRENADMTAQPAKSAGEPILLREVVDGVATLTLNRPSARNALSMELMTLLTE